jgi:hypothetical protein
MRRFNALGPPNKRLTAACSLSQRCLYIQRAIHSALQSQVLIDRASHLCYGVWTPLKKMRFRAAARVALTVKIAAGLPVTEASRLEDLGRSRFKTREEAISPVKDVGAADLFTHSAHSPCLIDFWHFDCLL